MGCITRIGCLILLLILGAIAWLTRDRWLPMVGFRGPVASSGVVWEPLTDQRANRAAAAIQRLSTTNGAVYENLTGGEAASFIYRALLRQLPPSTDSAEAAVIGRDLVVRASVRTAELGGSAVLGSIASLLHDRERVQFAGTFRLIRPGLAEFVIEDVKVRSFDLPHSVIPQLVRRMEYGTRPEGTSPAGLPVVVPRWLGDVRIANGKITVYKSV